MNVSQIWVTTSQVQLRGAGFSLPGRDSSRPLFPAPTERVGTHACATGMSASATPAITQICELNRRRVPSPATVSEHRTQESVLKEIA
jgi:hypothetical protein